MVDLTEGAGGGVTDDDDEVQFVSRERRPSARRARSKWEQLKELVAAKGSDADAVLDGWVVRVERRRNGGTQGQMDTYFDAPGRKKLRSFNDVYEFLQLHGVGAARPSSSALPPARDGGRGVADRPPRAAERRRPLLDPLRARREQL